MPAFSHCFLKRFIAFSKDSPSFTRTPVIRVFTRAFSLGCGAENANEPGAGRRPAPVASERRNYRKTLPPSRASASAGLAAAGLVAALEDGVDHRRRHVRGREQDEQVVDEVGRLVREVVLRVLAGLERLVGLVHLVGLLDHLAADLRGLREELAGVAPGVPLVRLARLDRGPQLGEEAFVSHGVGSVPAGGLGLTSRPRARRYAFASCTVCFPSWKIDAASAASAIRSPSARCSRVPPPPEAITGIVTASQTRSSSSRSYPAWVPSRSMLVRRSSPAPRAAASRAHPIPSTPVGFEPPAT